MRSLKSVEFERKEYERKRQEWLNEHPELAVLDLRPRPSPIIVHDGVEYEVVWDGA